MENNQPVEQSPENNTETIFSGDEFSMEGYDKHIRQARNAIFVVAAILVINLIMFVYSIPAEYEYLWLDVTIWGLFIAGFIAGLVLEFLYKLATRKKRSQFKKTAKA